MLNIFNRKGKAWENRKIALGKKDDNQYKTIIKRINDWAKDGKLSTYTYELSELNKTKLLNEGFKVENEKDGKYNLKWNIYW